MPQRNGSPSPLARELRRSAGVNPSSDPAYPESLRRARRRAQRFALSLTLGFSSENEAPVRRRLDELELFVGCVSDDWRRGIVSANEATAAIHRYLDSAAAR
jgi:hypothetical protein